MKNGARKSEDMSKVEKSNKTEVEQSVSKTKLM